jgi:hypothetical protein
LAREAQNFDTCLVSVYSRPPRSLNNLTDTIRRTVNHRRRKLCDEILPVCMAL